MIESYVEIHVDQIEETHNVSHFPEDTQIAHNNLLTLFARVEIAQGNS